MLSEREQATKAEFAEWAIAHLSDTKVSAAARVGHDVRGEVMAQVVGRAIFALSDLLDADSWLVFCVEGDQDFAGMRKKRREDPTAKAVELHANIAKMIRELERPMMLEVQVLPVQRVTFNAGTRSEHHQTAVVIRFLAEGMGERCIVVSAE